MRAIAPQRGRSPQHGLGYEELEVAQGSPPDLEFDPPHLRAFMVAIAPHQLPPVGALCRHLGRLVVDAPIDALGLPGPEGEAGADMTGLVGGAGIPPTQERSSILTSQHHAFEVAEQIDASHAEAQGIDHWSQQLFEVPDRVERTMGLEELGPGLDTDRWQLGGRGKANAPALVIETEAVLAPTVRSEPEGQRSNVEGHRDRSPIGEQPIFLK